MFQVYIYTWTLEPLEDDFPLQPDVVNSGLDCGPLPGCTESYEFWDPKNTRS